MTSSPSGDTRIGTAIDLIQDAFASQCQTKAASTRRLSIAIANETVLLDVTGDDAAEHLGGIFRHLVSTDQDSQPALRIEFAELHEPYGAVLRQLAVPPPGLVAAEPAGPLMIELHESLASAIDRATGRVTTIADSLPKSPATHLGRPFAHAFGWLAAQRQAYVTHGAAIGLGGCGLLFAGNGGQGKSTTALACAAAGWDFASDDLVVLARNRDGTYTAHSLYATGRLHPAQAARFPSLVENWDSTLSPEDNKLTLFPRGTAISFARSMSIEAIVLPLVSAQGQGEIAPLPRAVALRSLLTDSVQVYPWLTRERAQFYAQAVETLPCYTLRVGPDIASIPTAVARVLERAIT